MTAMFSGKAVKTFLTRLMKKEVSLRLTPRVPESLEAPLVRKRAELAKELLNSHVFESAMQFMNEQIVSEIALTGPLDSDMRDVLYLKLQLVTELQETLSHFVNEYETMLQIKGIDLDTLYQQENVNG